MNQEFNFDLPTIWRDGLEASVGQRLTNGRLLRLFGYEQTGNALSDPALLRKYTEVEIMGINGAPSLFVKASSVISRRQNFVGYQISGAPICIGLNKTCEGHITFLGPTRCGKTVSASSFAHYTARHGFGGLAIGLKGWEKTTAGLLKAGCESPTRFDDRRKPVSAPFRYVSLGANTRSGAFNFFDQETFDLPLWMKTGNLLHALGQSGGESDPVRRYFVSCAQDLFQRTDWGQSAKEFDANIKRQKLDRDTLYNTASARNEISQIAAIQHLNLPRSHPASIDFAHMIKKGGWVYFDASFMDAGHVATAAAGLVAAAFISTKRKIAPNGIVFLLIDEAQMFPRAFLKQLIEQCSASGIRLILCYHTLSQMGEDWETISMTQTRFIFGAVPGSMTDEHLKSLFGTKKEYEVSFNTGEGANQMASITHSSGPVGNSVAVTSGSGESKQSSIGFQEKEKFVWNPNDTLELNYNPERYVLTATRELASWGPGAILCERGGLPMPFAEINRHADQVLANTTDTILPYGPLPKLLSAPSPKPEESPLRARYLALLDAAATDIRKQFSTV